MKLYNGLFLLPLALVMTACSDSPADPADPTNPDKEKPVGAEWYSGGELGTTFVQSSYAYEQPTPAIINQGMEQAFKNGELIFNKPYTNSEDEAFAGLGPLYVRRGCKYCHPNYGHGLRQTTYNSETYGNGYLLVVTDKNDTYLSSLTGMPQVGAVPPFKAPIDEKQIVINWLPYTDEWGNKFDDGETYELIYPEVTIPKSAYYVPLELGGNPIAYEDVVVRLESTIGLYGTGLLDAITDEDLKAQYIREEQAGVKLNPAIFANGEWTSLYGKTTHPKRFTYALSRGPLQDAAGANAIWNITNVTRSDRRYHYMTATYAKTAAADPDVQKDFYKYFPKQNKSGDPATDIYNYLMSKELDAEMSDQDYTDLMVWHRGLAVPAARDVDTEEFQRGKELFTSMGCAYCHRPSWTTGDDIFTDPNGFFKDGDSRLPRYPHQTIWPYTDMVQHRLFMKNDIRTGWCRSTPLWGRGLHSIVTGREDRLHDCRARNVIESIMWHGSAESDARSSVEKFRQLSKKDRDAVVFFINSI